MKSRTIVQFIVLLLIILFLLVIFIENINLRRKVQVDYEQYRTEVHKAVSKAILADQTEDVMLSLALNASAQASVQTAADLVGGHRQLSLLSGLDTAHIHNTMVYHERQIRQVAIQKGLLTAHALNEASFIETNKTAVTPPHQQQHITQ